MAAEPRAPLESTPLIIQRRGDPSMRVMNANRRGKDIVLIDESGGYRASLCFLVHYCHLTKLPSAVDQLSLDPVRFGLAAV